MESSLWLTLIATCVLLKSSHSISDYEEGLPFDLGCSESMDIVILLDTTINNSTQNDEFKKFLLDLVEDFQIDSGIARVAFVTFSSSPVLHFRLDKYSSKSDIKSAIESAIFTPGERNFADAFDLLRRQVFFEPYGDRPDAPNVILLITTGNSERKKYEASQQVQFLKDQVSILVISKGVKDMTEIHSFASDPYLENTYELAPSENISLIKDLAYVGICSITTTYIYDNEEIEGSAVTATGSNKTDLTLLLHYSDTTAERDFNLMVQFLQSLIANADVDNDDVRVAFLVYGMGTTTIFDFNDYKQNKKKLLNALNIDFSSWGSEEANLAGALDVVRTSIFVEASGDRLDVPNTLLVITNDNSDSKYVPAFPKSVAEMKNTGVTMIGVGLNLYNKDEVNALSDSHTFSFILNDASQLSVVLQDIQNRLPSLNKILSTTPSIVFEESTLDTTDFTNGIDSNVKADIAVVFHASHKTKAKDFKNNLLNFISSLFAKARIDSGEVRVALVNYGASGKILFNFNKYSKKSDLRKAIRKSSPKVRNSNANLGDAIHLVRTQLFTKQEGARTEEGVPSAIILITDWPSSRSAYSVQDEVSRLKTDFKTPIFTIGVEKADLKELQKISSTPTGNHFQSVTQYKDLISNRDILTNVVNGIRALQGRKSKKTTHATSAPGLNTEPWPSPNINLAILFQSYGTTKPKDFYKHLLPFMASIVQYPDLPKHRTDVAVINYGKSVNIIKQFKGSISLNETRNTIIGLSKTLRSKSAVLCQAMEEALKSIQNLENVKTASNQILIITDTMASDNCTSVKDKLQSSEVDVQAVTVGVSNDGQIKSLTEQRESGSLLKVGSYQDLLSKSHILDVVAQNIIHNADSKEHRLKALNKIGQKKDDSLADIAFVLHASTRVSKRNFKRQFLKYVIKLVKRAKISPSGVRVALIVYGETPTVVFNFKDHLGKKSLIKGIKRTPKRLRFDSANLGNAVAKARELFLQEKARVGEKILIILTDMNPTGDHFVLQSEISQAKHEGIKVNIIPVALTNKTVLESIASRPLEKHFYHVKSYKDLQVYKKSGKPVVQNIRFFQKKKKGKRNSIITTTVATPWPTAITILSSKRIQAQTSTFVYPHQPMFHML
ncbi:collagen alpha-6(VI) chain-like [Saccostrea echinata]|uniref:collagen alpha-6(VI) chain-like n=1 Tax=Saccostrea echinata TaxID=191078 RepID=UPI002A7F55FE|nr:collagen alpha-6(VI) chain-like [Saccostrea echinata]